MEKNKSMGVLDLVRQEIERLRREIDDHNYYLDNSEQALGYSAALDDIEKFLNTLSEEPDKSLEEAAEEYSNKNEYMDVGFCVEPVYIGHKTERAFIAGAEWMAAQGVNHELEVKADAGGYPYIDKTFELYDYTEEKNIFNPGDKVIVNIRKKEEI